MTEVKRHVEIAGYGVCLPKNTVQFKDHTRYRVVENEETQLDLAEAAIQAALENANLSMKDIDCLVSASAVGVQPIPCTAALIHERVAKGLSIPAMDINTTCTSFISALSTMSYLIEAGEYHRVLIVSSEVGSLGLNPKQKESYELFGDGAAAFIFQASNKDKGVIASLQRTWSEGAHDTEIRGGLTSYQPKEYSEETKTNFMFDMKGKKILLLSARVIPEMFQEFQEKSGISKDAVDYIIPHQASRALPLVMDKLGVSKDKYLNIVSEYGNMVSVAVPFSLAYALEHGYVKEGDTIFLMGTAAGMTVNMLALKL
ncbi:3-oxoacyl-[acyl-carrier-protein] synthase III C-terminal domain-containing protein [Streptococcus infantis]|uniref:3-oxoacyl-[acyl-carrier-protein] synthase III C-terminal domain-containing protein n=1 Tax=Streptococcus infantis TaxID=68892 RepID=UPI0020C924A2|nr:3-oxoacyl-[acyl-carrier-protein] synthase III C-terminal domain-containing protein [Streptococcus infantis]MCP9057369.1 3-oxoacyl-ACP synthase [Streptococcus infantis]MCP9081772.1 3-oxoacyl-ACP synthase [Streptococcus infantis]